MNNVILYPLMLLCAAAVFIILRSWVIWSLAHDPHDKLDDEADFEEWYDDECRNAASELVGPNSIEYERLVEKFVDDPERKAAARKFYCGML